MTAPAPDWRKARASIGNGACVEVAAPGPVLVRDSTDRGGTELAFSAGAWRKFRETITEQGNS